jgi:putative ABC transport system permease protein
VKLRDAAALATGFAALRANPLRTSLSTLGIVMGVAALVAVLSVGDGVERFARDQLARTTDLLSVSLVSRASREVDGVQVPNPVIPRFDIPLARDLARRLPAGARVELVVTGAGLVSAPGGGRARGATVVARWGEADSAGLALGRPIGGDESGVPPVAVVGHSLALLLAGGGDVATALGDSIVVGDAVVEVVGVFAPLGAERTFRVVVPYPLAERAMAPSPVPRLPTLRAQAPRLEAVAELRLAVERWVADQDSSWRGAVTIQSNEFRLAQASQGALVFKILMGTIAAVSLLVGGIGIMNVLLAAVAERTREIGIRKAAGARRRDVVLQFLAESVTISGLGSLIGVGLGFAIAAVGTAVMRSRTLAPVHAGWSWSTVVVAAGAAIVVGLGFGLYPALRAGRLDPIEAIRHE